MKRVAELLGACEIIPYSTAKIQQIKIVTELMLKFLTFKDLTDISRGDSARLP